MDKSLSSCIIVFSCRLAYFQAFGPLAHLVERLLCKQEVIGSSPIGSTHLKAGGYPAKAG